MEVLESETTALDMKLKHNDQDFSLESTWENPLAIAAYMAALLGVSVYALGERVLEIHNFKGNLMVTWVSEPHPVEMRAAQRAWEAVVGATEVEHSVGECSWCSAIARIVKKS